MTQARVRSRVTVITRVPARVNDLVRVAVQDEVGVTVHSPTSDLRLKPCWTIFGRVCAGQDEGYG